MKRLQVGDTAPQFTLNNQADMPVSLVEFKGKKVLIYFYPKALTPGCTTQACGLRDAKKELEKLGVVILGISPDSPKKLAQFIEKKALNFTLLSDENHQVAEQFGVWGEKKFMGRTYDGIHRISFLIDEQGKIQQVFDKFKTGEHHQVVLDYLQSL
ncbi:thioredoxin-dependent thiol peroxidase [Rodentibacter pneumotropicus]|uniref:thioredoxin-dependent peroxiredoxin n=1 Tax=Rodentibacter pneumotropicus TaxID=758 RepID=A0A4V3SP44_9PAST|nr:thioredoxin-dependent thiol peroxidase [Rodentibacter pneumotropicus]MDC2825437.1 thioredoxin-dependent thiol peroxidase [Rodentibacter pneumotropicus]OOF63457.1 thioredoxin-dependent thiol peroxidase [Rodentibacter pneumotropicus]THA02066.1 thioredoxin-dependent thiol peroxidase [Rodentibacter pneumotropicus]THA02524.1 thioredoxin-dependent thiol peroxidase [Rodentibacter pneumotropicus]THA06895.1 thioredoxin-dependent thiol peroxidase [Rodentibacter pneumotropicus]